MRVLNTGGFANPDVLMVESGGRLLIVKDYGARGPLVRRWLAPLLVRREHALLERVSGLPGLPAPLGLIDRHALAMEFLAGRSLRRRFHGSALPRAFFVALQGVLDGLAARGVTHLDLSSPSNVLATESGAPALVDLGGATAAPLPRWLITRVERRALAKLERRFLGGASPEPGPAELGCTRIDLGSARFLIRDRGPAGDPCPILLLPDAGHTGAFFLPLLDEAAHYGRRAIAVDLAGFGGSRGPRGPLHVRRVARALARLARGLRLERVALVGVGWGGIVARVLAAAEPALVQSLLTFGTPRDRLAGAFAARWREALDAPRRLRERLAAELPAELPASVRGYMKEELRGLDSRRLRSPYRWLPVRDDRLVGLPDPPQPWVDGSERGLEQPLADPERFYELVSGR